ncbi:hypothetical protein BGZ65_008743 [Modicella reniformis]|uniref:Transmembrane protein n=1 Tax=Modicella reniformis TaxID=1440133 RepID=A0A9P6LRZ2_9FUNG|nr:hypothetical protein BGZ65_008743 [Modicella reniformis]
MVAFKALHSILFAAVLLGSTALAAPAPDASVLGGGGNQCTECCGKKPYCGPDCPIDLCVFVGICGICPIVIDLDVLCLPH